MSLLQSFRNLPPKARIGVGLGLLAWGFVGLRVSDRAEERYFKPTEADLAALPRITMVDRDSSDDTAASNTTTTTQQQRRGGDT